MAYVELPNSTFLDYSSYGTTHAGTVDSAYRLGGVYSAATDTINVALTLPRLADPTALLMSDWATRQTTLAQMERDGTLWSTFGASQTVYHDTINTLEGMGIHVLGRDGTDGYISSAESRTIWVQLDPTQFQTLFNTQPYKGYSNEAASFGAGQLYFWNGKLSLPDTLNVEGIWFDTAPIWGTPPAVGTLSDQSSVVPPTGMLSIGNELGATFVDGRSQQSNALAGDIADWFYNFPLTRLDVPTEIIGLLEPGVGDALPPGAAETFQQRLDAYRQTIGLSTPGDYYLVAHNGESYGNGGYPYYYANPGERTFDVSIATSANPNSPIGLYAGSGFDNNANANAYAAFQSAFWDRAHNPPVISSSFSIFQQSAPNSPFAAAVNELFIDAALRNITMVFANNDYGSSWSLGNGLANEAVNVTSPFAITVGGTSITTLAAAPYDSTVLDPNSPAHSLYGLALTGDRETLWQLAAGGLMVLPSSVTSDADRVTLLEAVWNQYRMYEDGTLSPSLIGAAAGDGGVDLSKETPWYQTAFGLSPTSANPGGGTGRGVPDVSADSGGNLYYLSLNSDMNGPLGGGYGTSAAAPLWASLVAQIDTVFKDQGLPRLGFMNDLLYNAAAIAPAAFNDITYGNNITSFHWDEDGAIINDGRHTTLTGYGYKATPGYDLATGLGTPNGVLLTRALTAIAHAQMHFADEPDVIRTVSSGGDASATVSGAGQSLLFQPILAADQDWSLDLGDQSTTVSGKASGDYAWTSRFAQQSLQADFSAELVTMFDKYSHGPVHQITVAAGEGIGITIGGGSTSQPQASLTTPYGFVDFVSHDADSAMQVARPVAVAETAGGADDQNAVVRMRQNGINDVSVLFYKVDDLSGTINGITPGAAGYREAVDARAYHTTEGNTSVHGPGYGAYHQTEITGVDAGDLIAMKLTSGTETFFAFATANEVVDGEHVGHLWNYGLNTWGWEDLYGGGDHDFNDLVVQLDFTSASGHGWLV
ncbi:DUF4114 domain-containing protein [Aquabacter sp. CN5-332]|uniref:DUF4114 domain-containing protein n=1 Tax=Aquabacter sp. CN5-332 TaxID=3156608 RepID=UPI0032B3CA47